MPARKHYLVVAERARKEARSEYQSVETYQGVKWGFLTLPPLPKWYESAKDVLAYAIELAPKEESFGLIVNLEDREACVFPRDPIISKTIEGVISDLIREKRRAERGESRIKPSIGIGGVQNSSAQRDILKYTCEVIKDALALYSELAHPIFRVEPKRRSAQNYSRHGKADRRRAS